MRLLEAIVDANQRRLAGNPSATVATADFASALPLAALTCIDARLNRLLPDMLGIAEEQFVWLRNAGNIITGPLSSTTRSLALACAVKGANEIAIIGHSDCQVGKTTMLQLLDRFGKLGVDRSRLPDNLVEYFGLFGSERQNVVQAVEIVRSSPLIGNNVPVHGLLIDINSGRLEWVVNGYEAAPRTPVLPGQIGRSIARAEQALQSIGDLSGAAARDLKLPTAKIGEVAATAEQYLRRAEQAAAEVVQKSEATAQTAGNAAEVLLPKRAKMVDPLATLQERMRQFSASKKDPGSRGNR